MSKREPGRIEVLSHVVEGRMRVVQAAEVMGLSARQVQRRLRTFREDVAPALRHKTRGRRSNNRLRDGVRDLALALVRESYADLGPTLAAETLAERHGLAVSRETLRTWTADDGLWLSRRRRRTFHQPRLRRERLGEPVQIDGSDHRWFEDRAPACTLLVFIDDATSRLMQMRFVPSESTFSYLEALERYLHEHGRPVAFYSDKHSIFRVAKADAASGQGMTQVSGAPWRSWTSGSWARTRARAKGRIEQANRTLQDRLVKEMRLKGISAKATADAFLPTFMARHNLRFAKVPARPGDLHRRLVDGPDRLQDVLCWRDQRYVGQQLTFSYLVI